MNPKEELEEVRGYLTRLLRSRYPEIDVLDSVIGICTQIDHVFAVGLIRCEHKLHELSIERDALRKWVESK